MRWYDRNEGQIPGNKISRKTAFLDTLLLDAWSAWQTVCACPVSDTTPKPLASDPRGPSLRAGSPPPPRGAWPGGTASLSSAARCAGPSVTAEKPQASPACRERDRAP